MIGSPAPPLRRHHTVAFVARYSKWKAAVLAGTGVFSVILAVAMAMASRDPNQPVIWFLSLLGVAIIMVGLTRCFHRREVVVMDAEGLTVPGVCANVPWNAIASVRTIGQFGSGSALLTVEGARRYADLPTLSIYRLGRRLWFYAATLGGSRLVIPLSGLDHAPERIIEEINSRAFLPPR